jgi:hypothetical protein
MDEDSDKPSDIRGDFRWSYPPSPREWIEGTHRSGIDSSPDEDRKSQLANLWRRMLAAIQRKE